MTFNRTGEQYRFDDPLWRGIATLTWQSDKNGNRISLTYDANDMVASITDTQGRVVSLTRAANNGVSALTDATGRTWRYGYDARAT